SFSNNHRTNWDFPPPLLVFFTNNLLVLLAVLVIPPPLLVFFTNNPPHELGFPYAHRQATTGIMFLALDACW
ncbi:MAG TPA: hypothetical protein VK517_14015, partial [Cyclobacteriaceae bacterium]|nr:hypothetical protein [Cyclobacteriaceae bacterium]